MKLDEAIAGFKTRLRADNRSPHTIKSYLRDVRLFAGWTGGDTVVLDITSQHLIDFAASDTLRLQADGAARMPSTMNKIKASLRAFFLHLADIGAVDGNPALVLKLKAPRTRPPLILTAEEQAQFLAALEADESTVAKRDRLFFELLLATGLRLGSAVALDIDDVNLTERRILVGVKGDNVLSIFIKNGLIPLLTDHIARLANQGVTTGPLFVSNRGQRISTREVQYRFKTWLDRAGISKNASVHSTRHTFATRLYRHTKDLRLVQRALGHRYLSTTQVYLHVADSELEAAIEAI